MGAEDWTSEEIDALASAGVNTERPSPARIYDYFLGGAHNFAIDRQVAEQLLAGYPEVIHMAQQNRAFLRRVVEFLVDAGVRQFLDIGSGVPTVGHVHEIAQARAPESRVVFVDIDPVAVAHSRLILDGNHRTATIQADVRRPEDILNAPELLDLFDMEQPIAVLLVSLLHFLSDDHGVGGIVSRLSKPLASGSYVAISHGTEDGQRDGSEGKEVYRRGGIDVTSRSRAQVTALFRGLELVEPGVVWVPLWHPDAPEDIGDAPHTSGYYGAVGRKP